MLLKPSKQFSALKKPGNFQGFSMSLKKQMSGKNQNK